MRGVSHIDALDRYGERIGGVPVEPLRVTCRTVTPVAGNDPVALDGVLAWAIVTEAMAGKHFPQGLGPIWQPLPLKLHSTIDGLPLWSSTDFVPFGMVKGSTHIHRRTADNPYAMPALRESLGDKRKRRYPNSGAGPYMDFRVPERRNIAERWEATCIGNKGEIERLLTYVQYFGKAQKRGCGFVLEWTVEPVDIFSLYNVEGAPLRPIPTEGGIGVQQGWTPPYWLKETWRLCQSSIVARMI
jgi:CRISPR type IV-associated protein Csf3